MTRMTANLEMSTSAPPSPVAISWVALLVPFALVAITLAIAGQHSWQQLAWTLPLLALPVAVLALRRQARRSSAG